MFSGLGFAIGVVAERLLFVYESVYHGVVDGIDFMFTHNPPHQP